LPDFADQHILPDSAHQQVLPDFADQHILPDSAHQQVLPDFADQHILPDSAHQQVLPDSVPNKTGTHIQDLQRRVGLSSLQG
jgi:hypothetical protein